MGVHSVAYLWMDSTSVFCVILYVLDCSYVSSYTVVDRCHEFLFVVLT